jgi:hypothetical protein
MILHIGMHKTGTSSIQHALADALVDDRFRFVQLAGYANGSLLIGNAYADLSGYPHHPDSSMEHRRLSRRNAMKVITTELNAFDERIPILSAELICSLEDDAKHALLDLLRRYHPELRVAAYIRRPKSLVDSAYQERLKSALVTINDHFEGVEYRKIFVAFDDFLGRQMVTIRLFEKENLHEGDVVADFAATWGIGIDRTRVLRENEALSQEAVKLLYTYRLAHPQVLEGDEHIIALLSDVGGERFRLHSSVYRRTAVIRPADIEWANERLQSNIEEDVTVDDDRAVKGDADMLVLRPETREFLASRLGIPRSSLCSPVEVAEVLSRYREKMKS